MTPEKAGFREQALNKMAEMALANQVEKTEKLEVRIKTDLGKIIRGEIDSIAIKINGLLMQQNLCLEELDLQIGRVVVKPRSAILGKIILTQPSQGKLQIVIDRDSLIGVLNSESFQNNFCQLQGSAEDKIIAINCDLQYKKIYFNCQVVGRESGEVQTLAFTVTPAIGVNKQTIIMENLHYLEEKELLPELTAALVAQVSEVLSLREFQQKGISLLFQQIDVAVGKLTLHADIYMEQFPSDK